MSKTLQNSSTSFFEQEMFAPSHRTFLLITFSSLALALVATAAFNAWIDPFQHYREPSVYPARFFPAFQRHQNPGLAKHRDYDTVVMGSSLFENLSSTAIARSLGGRTLNLSLSAMSSYDLSLQLAHVLRQGKARRIVIGIDLVAFTGGDKRVGYGGPPPLWAYNNTWLDDAPYLWSVSTTFRSVEALTNARFSRIALDRDRPWYWASDGMFSARATVTGLDPEHLNQRFAQPPMHLAELSANMERHLGVLLRAHPEVHFDLVFPPYSALVWADYRQRGALTPALAFKRAMIASLATLPHVAVHDFQTEAWVFELDRYKDIYHYDPRTSEMLLDRVASQSNRVHAKDAEAAVARLARLAAGVDAKAMIARALGTP
jgi:hypothetical protein